MKNHLEEKSGPAFLMSVTFGIGWLIPWLLYRNDKNSKGFLHEPVSGVFIVLFLFAAGAVMFTFEVDKIHVTHLRWWNGLLFVLHLASGVALAWLASTSGTWTAYVTFGRSQWGKNKPDNATSGFDTDTCQDGNCYITTVPCLLSQANIEYMVLAFHLLSTLQHLAVVLDWGDHYSDNIQDGKHWMRWFEYAFSASIMFASWAFLCGITDVIALVPLCVCVGTTQMFGYFSDAAARMKPRWELDGSGADDGSEQWNLCNCYDFCARLKRYGKLFAKFMLYVLAGVLAPIVYVPIKLYQACKTVSSSEWESAKNIPDTTQFKIVGTVYVAMAAVLAWPLCVQGDPELLRDVTVGVLGVHYVFLLVGFVIGCLADDDKLKQIQKNLYPTMQARFAYFYVLYDAAALVYVLVTWISNMDSMSQESANDCAFIALGSIALCLLKLAPSANGGTKTLSKIGLETEKLTSTPSAAETPQQRFIDPIWIFTLAWVPYLLGAWFMTFAVFHDSLQHPGPNAGDPPDALYVIIVTQFLFFSCFAGAQIWYLWNPSQQRYLDTEFYFCLLSLVSKTALAWSLYSGASGRKDFGLVAPGVRQAGQNYTGMDLPPC